MPTLADYDRKDEQGYAGTVSAVGRLAMTDRVLEDHWCGPADEKYEESNG